MTLRSGKIVSSYQFGKSGAFLRGAALAAPRTLWFDRGGGPSTPLQPLTISMASGRLSDPSRSGNSRSPDGEPSPSLQTNANRMRCPEITRPPRLAPTRPRVCRCPRRQRCCRREQGPATPQPTRRGLVRSREELYSRDTPASRRQPPSRARLPDVAIKDDDAAPGALAAAASNPPSQPRTPTHFAQPEH